MTAKIHKCLVRVDGHRLICDDHWTANIEGLRFGKVGDVPLSKIAKSIAILINTAPQPAFLAELNKETT